MASILSLLHTPEPPHLTMRARPGTKSLAELKTELDAILANPGLDSRYCALSRAAVYLWHDHFEPSHELAQSIENAVRLPGRESENCADGDERGSGGAPAYPAR